MNIVMLWYQHDWGLYGRRYEMIARTWVQEHPGDRVVVMQPPLNPWIWSREFWKALKAGDRVLIGYWLSCLWRLISPLKQENERLWVLRPFLWWPFKSSGTSRWTQFSYASAWATLRRFMAAHHWKSSLLWAYPPHSFVQYGVAQWDQGRVCVDLVEDHTEYQTLSETLRHDYETFYSHLLDRADVVFSVSQALASRHSSPNKPVIHIPNAVSLQPHPANPWKLPAIPAGPRVCYVGFLDERVDIPLLREILERLPKVQFIFVGSFDKRTVRQWDDQIRTQPNAHFLGTIPSAHLPSVLAAMDICMLPHRVTPLTESMDPLKLYAYLAAGKPVITTAVTMESSLKPWVRCVHSADEFESALQELLQSESPLSKPDLSSHGWPQRVLAMAGHLK